MTDLARNGGCARERIGMTTNNEFNLPDGTSVPLPQPVQGWNEPPAPTPPMTGVTYPGVYVEELTYFAPPPRPRLPRVWAAIVVPLVATAAAAFAASVALAVAAMQKMGPAVLAKQDEFVKWATTYGSTPGGFLVLVLPGQLTFLAVAIGAAALSPERIKQRLAWRRPTVPWWAMLLLLPATLFASFCGDLLTSLIFKNTHSDNLEMLYNLFHGASGGFLVLVTFAISVLPGFSEEMLFRGYCQSRLVKRIHPAAAIAISSVMFASAHLDPVHVVGVLPIGIWLGVVAWLTRSIWPSILCHAANNATAVLLTSFDVAGSDDHIRFDAQGLTMIGVSGALAAISVWVMVRYRTRSSLSPVPGGEGKGEGPIVERRD